MQIAIKDPRNQLGDTGRDWMKSRASLALGRFANRISRVEISLDDVNGPKGGDDKICRVTADLHRIGVMSVGQTDAELGTALNKGLSRIERRIQRELDKRHHARVHQPGHKRVEVPDLEELQTE
jgi:hypothetical protein